MSNSSPSSVTVWVQQASGTSTCFLSTTRWHQKTLTPSCQGGSIQTLPCWLCARVDLFNVLPQTTPSCLREGR